eukprot:EG_transcript_13676
MPIRPVPRLKRCKYCGKKGHKSQECPALGEDTGGDPKAAKAISCMTWIPQGASAARLRKAQDAPRPTEAEEEAVMEVAQDDSDSDAELAITETDYLFVAGRVNQRKEEYSIYVTVYDYERDRQFERQDIILSHPPLHVSWLDYSPSGERGSYAAVCTMLPCVEVFDLDKKNDLRAVCSLGGAVDPEDQYKTVDPKHPYRLVPGSHTDSVLFSDWNRLEPSVVATGSADQTIKLWDLNTAACAGTLRVHSSEVLSVRWHPQERSVILSSGLRDHSVVLSHADRQKDSLRWDIGCTAECALWHPHHTQLFVVGTAGGEVRVFDARKNGPALYSFTAHPAGECSCIAFNTHIEGLMATGSNDKHIALWDVRRGHQEIVRRELGVGEVFALEFNPNNPFLLLGGGSTAEELVWTVSEDIRACEFSLASS